MKPRPNRKIASVILVTLVALLLAPIALLAMALVEEKIIGTFYIADFCRQLGIFEEAEWLVQTITGFF